MYCVSCASSALRALITPSRKMSSHPLHLTSLMAFTTSLVLLMRSSFTFITALAMTRSRRVMRPLMGDITSISAMPANVDTPSSL